MKVEFRPRDYAAQAKAHFLLRIPTTFHPLSSSSLQGDVMDEEKNDTLDPLRATCGRLSDFREDTNDAAKTSKLGDTLSKSTDILATEWNTFKRFLVQRFPAPKMISTSMIADFMIESNNDESEDPQSSVDEDVKYVSQQEYITKLSELKNDIAHAWGVNDPFRSLKLSVKAAGLLRDTAVLQFYPTLFTQVTEMLDMLGVMVWDRIKQKVEYSEDGTQIRSLQADFRVSDVCSSATDTCYNWFCKIGSIRELLPRIYLELAILRCWRFLCDDLTDVVHRLVAMLRGLGDPLASAYCHIYLAYCVDKLPSSDKGYLIACIRDVNLMMVTVLSSNENTIKKSSTNKQVIIRLMEPSVEYIMQCIFKKPHQEATSMLVELGVVRNQSKVVGKSSCLSLVLHYFLKELPLRVVDSSALEILDLIVCTKDSSFDQRMNFRLLGFRLYEEGPPFDVMSMILKRVIQVLSQYQDLDSFLKIVDGYVDIVLQNEMNSELEIILEGIEERACKKWISDSEMESLQSVFTKILAHTKCVQDVLDLNHLVEILDNMRGNPRNGIYIRMLEIATRNGSICNPSTVEFLFEGCQGLSDIIDDASTMDVDNQALRHLLSRFVQLVDFGTEWERHLTFLMECRAAFACADEVKETLVHCGNCLAMRAMKDPKQHFPFIRSCLAFCEVTIPSVSDPVKQFSLYIETVEVALMSGSVSHSDGLIDSALRCLQSFVATKDSLVQVDAEKIICMVQKLCSLLIMVPGKPRQEVTYIPKSLVSLIDTQLSWMTAGLRVRILCAIMSSLAALSQKKLPYHADSVEVVPGNDLLFFDDLSYHEELASLCGCILQILVPSIQQEAYADTRGILALEACNCILLSLKVDDATFQVCKELMDIAASCLSSEHYYLLSTSNLLSRQLQYVNSST